MSKSCKKCGKKKITDKEIQEIFVKVLNLKKLQKGDDWVDLLFEGYPKLDDAGQAPEHIYYIYHTINLFYTYKNKLNKLNNNNNSYLNLYKTVKKLFTLDELKYIGI